MGTFGFLGEHFIKSRKFPFVLDSLGELIIFRAEQKEFTFEL